jgi:sulfoxide reductase heme-binding subunit YedZ
MWKTRWPDRIVFLACLLPLLWISWKWYRNDLGVNQIETVARFTGRWTLRILLFSLAITPLRRIPGLNPIIRLRRMVGLFAFFYGTLHGIHYFWRDAQWDWPVIGEDLTFRRFFIAGFAALMLMVPLAATSFNAAIRWMGGKRWQALHRLVYLSAVLALIHYVWQFKTLTPTPVLYGAVLVFLLGYRVVAAIAKQKTPPAKPRPSPAAPARSAV